MGDAGDIDVQGLQALGQGAMSAIAAPADQKQQDAMQQGDLEQMQGITSVKRDGEKTTITGTNAMIDYLHKSLMEGAQLKHHVSQVEQVLQGELQKVQNRENAYNRSPILGALANIAGNMAQAPKMPGVVQALGRSSVQLNPGPLAIQGQKMNILEALDQAHRTSVADERADFNQNLQAADFEMRAVGEARRYQEESRKLTEDRAKDAAKVMDGFSKDAQEGRFDGKSGLALAQTITGDPKKAQQIVDYYDRKNTQSKIDKATALEIADRKEREKFQEHLTLQTRAEETSFKKMMAGIDAKTEATKEVDKFKSTLPTAAQAKMGQAQETDLHTINRALITLKDAEKTIKPFADAESSTRLGQIGANLARRGQFLEYEAGLSVQGEEVQNAADALVSLAGVLTAMPYASKSRNYQWLLKIQEHVPDARKQTYRAQMDRITIAKKKLAEFRDDLYTNIKKDGNNAAPIDISGPVSADEALKAWGIDKK